MQRVRAAQHGRLLQPPVLQCTTQGALSLYHEEKKNSHKIKKNFPQKGLPENQNGSSCFPHAAADEAQWDLAQIRHTALWGILYLLSIVLTGPFSLRTLKTAEAAFGHHFAQKSCRTGTGKYIHQVNFDCWRNTFKPQP